ncbi:hypothetical protein [Kalamiella sp. sgz302252]|uniref:hypothetical protein n=1 Tax=Pantoea sp. sgz302252 TaxID=3341827 RepID=UPI0036D3322A
MNDKELERMVVRILQRLQPPVAVLVTAASGYREIIRDRLASCGQRLQVWLDEGLTDSEQWQTLGNALSVVGQPPEPCRALVLPFLDYSLAAGLVNGTLQNPAAMRIQEALLAGLPVLALRYHCDPYSELNQLRGAVARSAYAEQRQATLARLAECGVTLCSMNELLEKLASSELTRKSSGNTAEPTPVAGPHRYLTVADVSGNPALASAPAARLTDAARDFIKNNKLWS